MREETPESPSRWLPTPPVKFSPLKTQRRRVQSPRPEAVRGYNCKDFYTRLFFFIVTQLYFEHSTKCVKMKLHGVCFLVLRYLENLKRNIFSINRFTTISFCRLLFEKR